jgi:hypothetical protein
MRTVKVTYPGLNCGNSAKNPTINASATPIPTAISATLSHTVLRLLWFDKRHHTTHAYFTR